MAKSTLKDLGFQVDYVEIFDNFTGDVGLRNKDIEIMVDLKSGQVKFDSIRREASTELTKFFDLTNLNDYYASYCDNDWVIYDPRYANCNTAEREPDIKDFDTYPLNDQYVYLNQTAKLELQIMLSVFLTQSTMEVLK